MIAYKIIKVDKLKYYESNKYNENYEKSKNLTQLNGYNTIESSIKDYSLILELANDLKNIKTICDLGCGSGILLKYLINNLQYNFIPYGYEYNELAIQELKKLVLPDYVDNFYNIDFNLLKEVKYSLVIFMFNETNIQDKIHADYLIVRTRINSKNNEDDNFIKKYNNKILKKMSNPGIHNYYLVKG